jgi:cytochrome c peroxidase
MRLLARLPALCLAVIGSLVANGAARLAAQGGSLPPVPVPPENPLTPAKIDLGKALFWDEQLSATKTVACATCHIPEAGGGDPRTARALHPGFDGSFGTDDDVRGSFGVIRMDTNQGYRWDPDFGLAPQVTRRKAPSVFMSAYDRELFWDGRAPEQFYDPITRKLVIPLGGALERQATIPLLSETEMTHSGTEWPDVVARIVEAKPLGLARRVPRALARYLGDATYPELFARAFGTRDVTPVRIAMAIASYQRTLIPNQAPIDRFLAGQIEALTELERSGLAVFERAR